MEKNSACCPDIGRMMAYFLKKLGIEEKVWMEEHFQECDLCIDMARDVDYALLKLEALKARPSMGMDWEIYGDAPELKVAGEAASNTIKELITKKGRYRIILSPFIKNPEKALLEIEVLDQALQADYLRVMGTNGFRFVLMLNDNRMASAVVSSAIDIEKLIVLAQHE